MLLDQMFTAENFRKIYDIENRRGFDLSSQFFPDFEPLTLAVRESVKQIREHRSKKALQSQEEFEEKLAELKVELAKRKFEKSHAVDNEMELISSKVLKTSFKLSLIEKLGPNAKPIFCIDGTPETYFVVKQLQRNINKIYGVKQSNRHDLVCQIRDTIRSKFPFEIVRTDISSFYESIDRKRLLDKLDADQLLSSSSKKYIKQILDSYGSIVGSPVGIPRGVGISAYLAELYLRPVDRKVKQIPGLVVYCRYVDDIVAIFARPPSAQASSDYQDVIINILLNHGLTHNALKTDQFKLGSVAKKLEYLGYCFLLQHGHCTIFPSAAKLARYSARLAAAFNDYNDNASVKSRRAYRDLVSRVKFLTGNTRLSNSKSSAVTGIYYNNSLVTESSSFAELDGLLKTHINSLKRPGLRSRLKAYKFTAGFLERRFHNFSAAELQNIVRVWKHG
jgi:hypothetical protein